MRERCVWASVATVGIAAGLGVVGAAPASAADTTVAIDCSQGTATVDVVLAAGDVLTVEASNCLSAALFEDPAPTAQLSGATGDCATSFPNPYELLIGTSVACPSGFFTQSVQTAPAPAEGGVMIRWSSDTERDRGNLVTIRIVAAPAADSAPIPPWVQAYGRASANAACEDGWDPSWQEWAQPMTGGWVCTRSIPSLG